MTCNKMLRGFFGSSEKTAKKKKKKDNSSSTEDSTSSPTTSGTRTSNYSKSSTSDCSESKLHSIPFSVSADSREKAP